MELYLETFPIDELVQGVNSTIRPLMENNGNRFEVDSPETVGSMHADLTKTRQILFNLLSNAAKFTSQGRVLLDVARKRDNGQEWLRFRVSDNGIGMTPEQLAKVFEPFSQADVSTTRQYGGTGLGLSICKRFSEMMGGDIFAESELGQGTVFTVQLPATVREGPQDEAPKRPVRLADSGIHQMPAYGTQRAPRVGSSVLVIDDDPVAHELLTGILTKEGFSVTCSSSADEGLEKARRLRPDLITLDVKMPGKDGWHLLAELKAEPTLAEIPVIMISVVDDQKTAYALGASDYVTKPVDRSRLTALLEKYRQSNANPKVLVVDDDPDARRMLRSQLEGEGCTVFEAENGVAALRRVTEQQPDLILLDLLMPELDGFGFLAELRKTAAWRNIPVLVVTAMDIGPEEVRRLNGGVERVLQKGSFSLAQFKAELRSLTSRLGR